MSLEHCDGGVEGKGLETVGLPNRVKTLLYSRTGFADNINETTPLTMGAEKLVPRALV